ncbi:MAG: TonB-dependent receptor [Archangiaceae bacterium]|nr:TonB-dependent receptor [Archangiaceae bacterium]
MNALLLVCLSTLLEAQVFPEADPSATGADEVDAGMSEAVAPVATVAPAADGPAVDDLEALLQQTVVTGASKSAQVSSVAPATVTVITAETLSQFGVHSLDEALNYLSLGMVTQNPLHSVDIGARGVLLTGDFGNHVLLLLNGQTLNEQWDGTAYFERGAGVPWELVDHIEVIVGPGSVLYGSNAMLGVINVVTKRARDYGTFVGTVDLSGSAPVDAYDNVDLRRLDRGGGSVRVGVGGGARFKLMGEDAEVVGQLEWYRSAGPHFTFAPQAYGDDAVTGAPKSFGPRAMPGVWGGVAQSSYVTDVPAGHLKLAIGNFTAELRAASYWRSTPYINGFNQFLGDFDDGRSGERDRFVNLDLRYRREVTAWLAISADLYGALYDFRQDMFTSAAEDCAEGQYGCHRVATGASKWAGLQVSATADWASDGRWVTLLGVDGRLRDVGGSYESSTLSDQGVVEVSRYGQLEQVLGVYLQQEAHPWRWLSLNAGARLDIDSRFGARLSPRAAAAVHLPWNGTLKLLYAEAFRAPTAYELYYTDGATEIAAAHLRPEAVRSGELSYEQRFGLQRLMVGGFVAQWSQMVLLEQATEGEVDAALAAGQLKPGATEALIYRNASGILNVGGNVAFEGATLSNHLRYGVNFTVAHTARTLHDGTSQPLTVAPQAFGNARLLYDFGEGRPAVGLLAFFAAPRPADRAFDGEWASTPMAPAQLDLKLTVSGPLPWPVLSYRVSATYAFGARSPYVVGPLQDARPDYTMPQLAPVDRLQLGVQLIARWP